MKHDLIEITENILKSNKPIKRSDFLNCESIKNNPISLHLLNMYGGKDDFKWNKMIDDLYDYIHGSDYRKKMIFLFRFYDSDGDGKISKIDLIKVFRIITDGSLSERKMSEIIDMTCKEYIDIDIFIKLMEDPDGDIKKLFSF